MTIHFVCTGNTFRSRLAETYLRSKKIRGIKITSSGIEATTNENGPITWYAARIIDNRKLFVYTKSAWTQTKANHLKKANLVIFMRRYHYDWAIAKLGFTGKYEIWDIPDLDDLPLPSGTPGQFDAEKINASEEIFSLIRTKVDDLAKRLKIRRRNY